MAVAVLTVGFGVIDSQAQRRHGHSLTVRHYVKPQQLPARSDRSTSGVAQATAVCPRGYKATGGGYTTDKVSIVPFARLATNGYSVIAINQLDQAGRLAVNVACLKAKTSSYPAPRRRRAKRSGAAEPSLDAMVERYRRQLRQR